MNKTILFVFSLLTLGSMLTGCRDGVNAPVTQPSATPSATHAAIDPTQASTSASTQPSISPSSEASTQETGDTQHSENMPVPSSNAEGNPGNSGSARGSGQIMG